MGVLVSSNALERRRPSLPEALEARVFHCLNYSDALAAKARVGTNHDSELKKFAFLARLTSAAHNLGCTGNSDPCHPSVIWSFLRLSCKAEVDHGAL